MVLKLFKGVATSNTLRRVNQRIKPAESIRFVKDGDEDPYIDMDELGMDFGIEYSLKKKKRWMIENHLLRTISNYIRQFVNLVEYDENNCFYKCNPYIITKSVQGSKKVCVTTPTNEGTIYHPRQYCRGPNYRLCAPPDHPDQLTENRKQNKQEMKKSLRRYKLKLKENKTPVYLQKILVDHFRFGKEDPSQDIQSSVNLFMDICPEVKNSSQFLSSKWKSKEHFKDSSKVDKLEETTKQNEHYLPKMKQRQRQSIDFKNCIINLHSMSDNSFKEHQRRRPSLIPSNSNVLHSDDAQYHRFTFFTPKNNIRFPLLWLLKKSIEVKQYCNLQRQQRQQHRRWFHSNEVDTKQFDLSVMAELRRCVPHSGDLASLMTDHNDLNVVKRSSSRLFATIHFSSEVESMQIKPVETWNYNLLRDNYDHHFPQLTVAETFEKSTLLNVPSKKLFSSLFEDHQILCTNSSHSIKSVSSNASPQLGCLYYPQSKDENQIGTRPSTQLDDSRMHFSSPFLMSTNADVKNLERHSSLKSDVSRQLKPITCLESPRRIKQKKYIKDVADIEPIRELSLIRPKFPLRPIIKQRTCQKTSIGNKEMTTSKSCITVRFPPLQPLRNHPRNMPPPTLIVTNNNTQRHDFQHIKQSQKTTGKRMKGRVLLPPLHPLCSQKYSPYETQIVDESNTFSSAVHNPHII